jgi:hypothetical protein
MDRNAYRDDNGTDQIRMIGDAPRLYADHPRTPGDQDDSYPEEPEAYPDQPDTYWRRRAATLAAGLGVLGLLAWALSGGGGKPAPVPSHSPTLGALSYPGVSAAGQASAGASPAAGTNPGSSPGSNPGSSPGAGADAAIPGLGTHGTSDLPSATTSPASKSARANANAAKSDAAKSGAAAAAARTEPGGRCAPSSVVLSLFSASRSYRAGQNPQFGVDAVSTAAGTCTFDLGPTQLHLVVTSEGRVIWDSADCARGDGAQPVKLSRGVPVQEYFTWNRAITLPGCVTLASAARPGSYQAQARTPAITSGTFTFKLVR